MITVSPFRLCSPFTPLTHTHTHTPTPLDSSDKVYCYHVLLYTAMYENRYLLGKQKITTLLQAKYRKHTSTDPTILTKPDTHGYPVSASAARRLGRTYAPAPIDDGPSITDIRRQGGDYGDTTGCDTAMHQLIFPPGRSR
jgi:hypothetical protein